MKNKEIEKKITKVFNALDFDSIPPIKLENILN